MTAHLWVRKRNGMWYAHCRRCSTSGWNHSWKLVLIWGLGHLSLEHPQWPGFWDDHLKDMQDPEYAAAFRAGLSEPPC